METLLSLLIVGIAIGAVYGVVAIGFVLVYKASGVINLAQGSLLLVNAYVCHTLSVRLGLPFFLSALITLLFAFALGLAIERALLRPLINQPALAVIMLTIGIGEVLEGATGLIWGPLPMNLPPYLPAVYFRFLGVSLTPVVLLSIVVGLLLLLACALFFKLSRDGVAMRAASEDQTAAQSVGVSIGRVFGLSWALATMTAAIGGIILATMLSVYFNLSEIGMRVISAVIVGGVESIPGAFVGGLIVGVAANLAGGYVGEWLPAVEEVAPYVVLLLILIARPYGLFGQKKIERI